jgi:carbon monoxide dehydrogenase subunit G
MADVKYESKIGQITANDAAVFAVLSNLENINHFRDVIPQDKIHELEVSSDRVRFKVEGLGQKIAIVILEKEEYKTIKFGAENMPIPFNIWIQLKQVAELDTRIRITIKTDMPAMFKMMFDKKMQQGLDQAIDMLCQVPYASWANS